MKRLVEWIDAPVACFSPILRCLSHQPPIRRQEWRMNVGGTCIAPDQRECRGAACCCRSCTKCMSCSRSSNARAARRRNSVIQVSPTPVGQCTGPGYQRERLRSVRCLLAANGWKRYRQSALALPFAHPRVRRRLIWCSFLGRRDRSKKRLLLQPAPWFVLVRCPNY